MDEQVNRAAGIGIDQIVDDVRTLIAEIVEIPPETIKENSSFEELGVDSLMALEVVASIEKKYRIQVPEEELQRVKSFGDTIGLVREYLARATG